MGWSSYAAIKAAVVGYTKGWARDLGPKGITVNAVQPGPIDTDMNPADSAFRGRAHAAPDSPQTSAGPVVFLASDASACVTGQNPLCGRRLARRVDARVLGGRLPDRERRLPAPHWPA